MKIEVVFGTVPYRFTPNTGCVLRLPMFVDGVAVFIQGEEAVHEFFRAVRAIPLGSANPTVCNLLKLANDPERRVIEW